VSDSATLLGVTATAGGTVEYRFYPSLTACEAAAAAFPPATGGTLVSTVTVTGGVVPSSAAHTFPVAGRFYWAAFYSGDANNRPAPSSCASEPLVVTPAASQVTTRLSEADRVIGVGGSVSDSATLHGVTATAGGTVEYRVYPLLTACQAATSTFPPASGGTLVSRVTVTGGVVPPSAVHVFAVPGRFYWAAFYSGDASNRRAASDCASEPLVVTPAASQVTTQLSAANDEIGVGGSVADSATLHGVTGTAGGTVEYRFYPSLTACQAATAAFPPPGGGTLVSTVPVTGGVVPPSASHAFATAGTFYWAAFYSGDASNRAAVSDCATEALVVTPAQSRATTRLSATGGEIGVGGSVSDSATLHAVTSSAGGTLEYRFYPSLSSCASDTAVFPGTAPSGGTLQSTVTVTAGVVPPSAPHVFGLPGIFYWAAFYFGDLSNRAAASVCASEPLVVRPAPSQVTTQLSAADGEIGVGGSASDSATLLGVIARPRGSMPYRLYGSHWAVLRAAAVTAGGTVQYRYYGSLSGCQADVTAFPGTAPSGGTLVSTVTVTGGVVPSSAAITFPAAGTFYWAAFYSGDASNLPAASDCATEPLVVTPAPSQVTTQLSAADHVIRVGGSVSDAATLHAVTTTAVGTVEYRVYGSLSACETATSAFPPAGGGTLVSTVTVTGGIVPPSASHSFPVAGTFYWAAFYSGDASDRAVASLCAAEPLVVTPAPSRISTQLSAADRVIGVGGSASDSATLRGVTSAARGTVEYRVYGSLSACQTATAVFPPPTGGTLVSTVTVVAGRVPNSAAHAFPVPGTFYWAAFYSGDAGDLPAASACVTEPLVVTPAPSLLTTRLSVTDGEIGAGGSVSDSATLHGVTAAARGTLEYRVYGSLSACQSATSKFPPPSGGTLVSKVTVSRGKVPPSAPHTFPAAGRFYWAAFYSGDAANRATTSSCASEPLVVTEAPQPPASVIVNMDWVIAGASKLTTIHLTLAARGLREHVPSQDPNFQASLTLEPLIPPDEPATWGEERFGYFIGQSITIGVTDVQTPPGCRHTISGQVGTHTLTHATNVFLVVAAAVCDQSSSNPGIGTHLTLVKQIVNFFPNIRPVPLTSWTLTARRAPGEQPVISGTTGVTGNVEPGVQYVLAETNVPGYKQLHDPALIDLTPGATGSWICVENRPGGRSGLQDFDGGSGVVIVQPGQHVTCTAVNILTRLIPKGPTETGGGLTAANSPVPVMAVGLALMGVGALLGFGSFRQRRTRPLAHTHHRSVRPRAAATLRAGHHRKRGV
jgi:hypothetical protein